MFEATEKLIAETILEFVTAPPARAVLLGAVRGLAAGCETAGAYLAQRVNFDAVAQHAQLTRRLQFVAGHEPPVEKLEATLEALKERQRELELEGEIRRLRTTIEWQEAQQAPDARAEPPRCSVEQPARLPAHERELKGISATTPLEREQERFGDRVLSLPDGSPSGDLRHELGEVRPRQNAERCTRRASRRDSVARARAA